MPESMSEETENPSNCFGCAPHNPIGLRLVFERNGTGYTTRFRLGADYESFPGVIHGGIVAAVLDETLAQAVYRSGWVSAFTTGLRVRYGRPMETGAEYTAHAEITRRDETSVRASGEILRGRDLVATADGTFHLLTDDVLAARSDRLPDRLVEALTAANRNTNQGD
ncbi:PaaI family thioesterase [Streptomyces niveiscabiei]|uniref:PaaI family thioesterase n=1 Tax=Streptomyces niveiscabiei TaxID=164115 RepID=A0ABW9HWN8_9ACTN|nr:MULTISPECIES: PaaI family thioesterase [Streptomyces]